MSESAKTLSIHQKIEESVPEFKQCMQVVSELNQIWF